MRVRRYNTVGRLRPPGIPRVDYAHPLAQGLQAAYYFDAGLYDIAGNNPATVQGVSVGRFPSITGGLAAGFSDAKWGSGGFDSYLSIPSGRWNTSSVLSVCAWAMSMDATGGYRAIVSATYDGSTVPIEISLGDDSGSNPNRLNVSSFGGSWVHVSDPNALITNKWYFVCGVADGTNLNLYLDGRFISSGAATIATNNTSVYRIGTRHDTVSSTATWNGLISDVRVYNRALTPGDVWELYVNPGAGLIWPGIIALTPTPAAQSTLMGAISL